MSKKTVIKEDARIIRNRILNNKILDLELQRHKLSMQVKEIEKEILKNWWLKLFDKQVPWNKRKSHKIQLEIESINQDMEMLKAEIEKLKKEQVK